MDYEKEKGITGEIFVTAGVKSLSRRQMWHEMKRLNLADYEERQLEDFSKYVFGMSYQTIKDVMKQQKGREE